MKDFFIKMKDLFLQWKKLSFGEMGQNLSAIGQQEASIYGKHCKNKFFILTKNLSYTINNCFNFLKLNDIIDWNEKVKDCHNKTVLSIW